LFLSVQLNHFENIASFRTFMLKYMGLLIYSAMPNIFKQILFRNYLQREQKQQVQFFQNKNCGETILVLC